MKKKKPIYKRVWFWILAIVVVAIAIGSVGGGDDEKTAGSSSGTAEPIEYTVCTVDEMVDLLSENALSASDTYEGQYVEVTGRLDVIDSDGSYISIYPMNDEFAFTGVQCKIKNDEQLYTVKSLTKGQTVTIQGKVTNVGEVMGYTLDIEAIK